MLFPHTESRRIALRAAGRADAGTAYGILFRSGRGGLPLLDDFVEAFGQGSSACFLVHRRDTGEPVGLGTLGEQTLAGHIRAEVGLLPGQPAELLLDTSLLIMNYAFAMWRTRKVYFHATEAGGDPGFGDEHALMVREEAILPEHAYCFGRLWDVRILAVGRSEWDKYGTGFLKRIL